MGSQCILQHQSTRVCSCLVRGRKTGFTKDADSSPVHCFKKLGPKFFKNFFLFSAIRQLINIPSSVSEQFLKNFSSNKGMTKGFKFFQ
ncbi:rCG38915, partial [Rattus norvegicus]